MSSEAAAEDCGSALFLALPDDVLALISAHLLPRDLCALALCCRGLRAAVAASEKSWLAQCHRLGPPPLAIRLWRERLCSYRALCRFLVAVEPLLGVWVHQNPELGNVVCVLWGFLSVVGVRIIPQELGPLGLDAGPLLWAPVFEILADADGAPSCFFLHGRGDQGEDCLYPGSVQTIVSFCNVLLLEIDARHENPASPPNPLHLLHSRSSSAASACKDLTFVRKLRPLDSNIISSSSVARPPPSFIPFSRLSFSNRRRLLDQVAGRVRLEVPADLATAPLFDRCYPCDDPKMLARRWSELVKMHKRLSGGRIDRKAAELALGLMQRRTTGNGDVINHNQIAVSGKRKAFSSVAAYLIDGFKQLISRSNSSKVAGSGTQRKHAQLKEFLMTGDSIGLSLSAAHMRLTTYRVWPDMHDNWFALYKLPMQVPTAHREYAGLWGGAFGWPPGRPSEDKPGKALFFLLLSYEEVEGHLLLIATKILEGTHYVLHPNGSAMFIVKVDEAASDTFPWETDGECVRLEVKQSYSGEGIASGYGFRYPGFKPGSLFVLQNGMLAFVWKESKSVLTLQRVDLHELLKKGERVPMLPPVANFSYLTESYSNVFAGIQSNSNCSC